MYQGKVSFKRPLPNTRGTVHVVTLSYWSTFSKCIPRATHTTKRTFVTLELLDSCNIDVRSLASY